MKPGSTSDTVTVTDAPARFDTESHELAETVDANRIESLPTAERVRRGIAPVLEARRLFPRMTVYENLEMGAYTRKPGPEFHEDL